LKKLLAKNRKILLLGSSGQLGQSLLKILKEHCTFVLAPSSKKLDLSSRQSIINYFKNNTPEIIINCGAWTNVELAEKFPNKAFSINALGPLELAHQSKRYDSQLIHISTDYVFDGNSSSPLEIGASKSPQTTYGKSKSIGEDYILEVLPENSYIIRTSWLFSEYRTNFVKSILLQSKDVTKVVKVVNDQIGSPTYAKDLAFRIWEIICKQIPAGIYHVTNSGFTNWYDFARMIFQLVNENPDRIIPLDSIDYNSKILRPKYSVLSSSCWDFTEQGKLRNWEEALTEAIPIISRRL
jgi:dTDP-4-dehydrorhamnose reductase